MRMLLCGAVVFLSIAACTSQETNPFDGEKALALAREQVDLGPRIPGTPAHEAAADTIAKRLSDSNWHVEQQRFSYHGVEVRNVIGKRGDMSRGLILLGAHYDTRPVADRDPTTPTAPMPGANDGASGVSVLLELARVLPDQPEGPAVWLAFFDAEDSAGLNGWEGLVGSTYLAGSLTVKPRAVIVVDMVGDADLQLYLERNSDPQLAAQIWDQAARLGYSSFKPTRKYGLSDDHTPFLARGFPAVDIIDFDYPYWHTAADTLDKISAKSLEQVGRTLQAWLATQS